MQVFYRGFNLYGQYPKTERIIDVFIDQALENLISLEFSHSFSVLFNGNVVLYRGGNKDECNYAQEINVDGKDIVEIKCAEDRILLLKNDGGIYKVRVEDLDVVEKIPKFYESGDKIIKLSVGSKINVAYSSNGNIYNIPEKLMLRKSDVVDIKCGREHCLLLDKRGNLYSFGRGSRGQLGHGCLDDEDEPRQVEALAGLRVASIAAGGWHSCAITSDGDLYTWGWNGNGQLGLGTTNENGEIEVSVTAIPKVVDFDDPESNVTKVACGNRHTIVLLDNSKLYGCGWNKYKQLLKSEEANIHAMTYLHDFSKFNVVELKCGPWSSAVLCK